MKNGNIKYSKQIDGLEELFDNYLKSDKPKNTNAEIELQLFSISKEFFNIFLNHPTFDEKKTITKKTMIHTQIKDDAKYRIEKSDNKIVREIKKTIQKFFVTYYIQIVLSTARS